MAREMGDVGTHFLFENENVKVWDLILEPGQASPAPGTITRRTTCSSLLSPAV